MIKAELKSEGTFRFIIDASIFNVRICNLQMICRI